MTTTRCASRGAPFSCPAFAFAWASLFEKPSRRSLRLPEYDDRLSASTVQETQGARHAEILCTACNRCFGHRRPYHARANGCLSPPRRRPSLPRRPHRGRQFPRTLLSSSLLRLPRRLWLQLAMGRPSCLLLASPVLLPCKFRRLSRQCHSGGP